jgi:hypothetical protein
VDRETFNEFFDKTVRNLAKSLCDENEDLAFTENLDGLYEEYMNQITLLKLLVKNEDDSPEVMMLDRHKIAACITVAVMKTRLLHQDNIDDVNYTLIDASRINEQLAFFCGLNVVISYMAADPKIKDTLKVFLLPTTRYPDRSEYVDSIIRALYYSNIASGFSILLLSDIFFLLEEYHKLSYFSNNKETA